MMTTVPYAKAYGLDNIVAQDVLQSAAIVMLDQAFQDVDHIRLGDHLQAHAPREYQRIRAGGGFEAFESIALLPPRYEAHYQDLGFLRNWAVTLSIVGWKLAQPKPHALTNLAEELALHVMIEDAKATIGLRDLDEDEAAEEALHELYESAFEDTDFLVLYQERLPRAETRVFMRMTPLDFEEWFEPFGSGTDRGVVHPYILDVVGPTDG